MEICKGKEKKSKEFVRFNGGSLTEFADEYGGLDKLSALNKGIIPTKKEWNNFKNNDIEKTKIIIKKLHGKRIIVNEENETSFSFQEEKLEQPKFQAWNSPKETSYQSTDFGNSNELSGQLSQMERKLINEIQRIGSSNNNSNQLNELKKEKDDLETKFKTLETHKKNIDSNLHTATEEKTACKRN
ncbi:MAG: hypothetical protein M0D53_01085 [Flavobacterium sp. JAD_PAG50586_2]|nr:MAG: hypothetical protein M0D53_01085 [Flavobacterium sp. JAD_PAG50586_2]